MKIIIIVKNHEDSWKHSIREVPDEDLIIAVNYNGEENDAEANRMLATKKHRKSFRIEADTITEAASEAKARVYTCIVTTVEELPEDEAVELYFIEDARLFFHPKLRSAIARPVSKHLITNLNELYQPEKTADKTTEESISDKQTQAPAVIDEDSNTQQGKKVSMQSEQKAKEEKKPKAMRMNGSSPKRKPDPEKPSPQRPKQNPESPRKPSVEQKKEPATKKSTNKNGIEGSHKKLDYLFNKGRNRPEKVKEAEATLLFRYLNEFNTLMREVLKSGKEDLELQISDYHHIIDLAYRAQEKLDFVNSVETTFNSINLLDLSDESYQKIKKQAKRYVDACELIYGDNEEEREEET